MRIKEGDEKKLRKKKNLRHARGSRWKEESKYDALCVRDAVKERRMRVMGSSVIAEDRLAR